jgi:DNA-binding IclR family transcriptional regulator
MGTGSKDESMSTSGVAAVERALSILAAFEPDGSPRTLNELAAKTGLYKSTILRLIVSLERSKCLVRLADGRYELGPRLFHWGNIYRRSLKLEDHVVPVLQQLVQLTGESASFYARQGEQRLCLFRQDSPKSVRDHVRAGDLLPLDRGAAGRVLREYSARLDEPRRVQAVSTLGERDAETGAVAVPTFGASQELVGALSVSGPVGRFTDQSVLAITKALLNAARQLTERMGGDPSVYETSGTVTKLKRGSARRSAASM